MNFSCDPFTSVMIVEDSEIIRKRLKEQMKVHPHLLVVAESDNANEAICMATRFRPQILILDINLRGEENGFYVLQQLRKFLPDMLTVVLTNFPSPQHRKMAMDLGADYFYDKSNEFEIAIEKIKKQDTCC